MAQTYKFGRGTWATKEGSTLAYNDENENYKPLPFSFERDSIATRVNKERLIEVVGRDIPRIDYTDSTEGVLLLEASRTNYVQHSNDASQWSNVVSNGTVTKTADYAISPDGTQNATRLEASVSGSGYALISLANTTAFFGDYTSTVYVKSNTENNQDIVFYGRNTDFPKHTVTKEWTRIQFKGSSTSGQTNYSYLGISTSIRAEDNPIDILVWGGQLEQGSYPTSYIPTNGSTVQRAAETANGSGNSEVFNDSEGVLFVNHKPIINTNTNSATTVNNGTANRVYIGNNTADENLQFFMAVGGSSKINVLTPYPKNAYSKIAFSYKSGNSKGYVNGFQIFSDNVAFSDFTTLNKLSFNNGSTEVFKGSVKEVGYYDTILTDEELEYMTSYRSLSELVTELNLNTL